MPLVHLPPPSVAAVVASVFHSAVPVSHSHVPPSREDTVVGVHHFSKPLDDTRLPRSGIVTMLWVRQPHHSTTPRLQGEYTKYMSAIQSWYIRLP